ncbi:MAG: AbrB/MazE/SpoVT family DNA-binding domain-containing protein [Deltaproteobacteria bacterium]|nr:AbrB/MazE/SpoVT family DNA-binding domain-containing protein [Deltaproteobacteria bacterium]
METTLDKFGRIVIPKKVREDFNLKPGTQFSIEESEQAIILKPIHDKPNLILKDRVLVFSGTPTGNLDEALKKHCEEKQKLSAF